MAKTKNKGRRKSKKVKKERSKILYLIVGLVAAIFILTAGIMAIMVMDEIDDEPKKVMLVGDEPPETEKEPHLLVEDVFFMKSWSRADDEKVDITTTVYITNDGLGDAKEVKIVAFPIDDSKNLAGDKCRETVGTIGTQKTAEAEFSINVPTDMRQNVEILIFERGKLILRGDGAVVIQGTHSSTPKYETTQVMGTSNDTDYDGMPDQWEQYYGLDPSDSSDAKGDKDGDGVSNLGEYRSGTEPGLHMVEPNDDNEEEKGEGGLMGFGEDSTGATIGIMMIIAIIIIIIILFVAFMISKQQNQGKKYAINQAIYPNQYTQPGSFQAPPGQNTPRRCSKCGNWIVNNACTGCGERYPSITPGAGIIPETLKVNNDQSVP